MTSLVPIQWVSNGFKYFLHWFLDFVDKKSIFDPQQVQLIFLENVFIQGIICWLKDSYLVGHFVGYDPRDGLPHDFTLEVDPLDGYEHLREERERWSEQGHTKNTWTLYIPSNL